MYITSSDPLQLELHHFSIFHHQHISLLHHSTEQSSQPSSVIDKTTKAHFDTRTYLIPPQIPISFASNRFNLRYNNGSHQDWNDLGGRICNSQSRRRGYGKARPEQEEQRPIQPAPTSSNSSNNPSSLHQTPTAPPERVDRPTANTLPLTAPNTPCTSRSPNSSSNNTRTRTSLEALIIKRRSCNTNRRAPARFSSPRVDISMLKPAPRRPLISQTARAWRREVENYRTLLN